MTLKKKTRAVCLFSRDTGNALIRRGFFDGWRSAGKGWPSRSGPAVSFLACKETPRAIPQLQPLALVDAQRRASCVQAFGLAAPALLDESATSTPREAPAWTSEPFGPEDFGGSDYPPGLPDPMVKRLDRGGSE